MLNIERRSKNDEVGIRVLTQMALLRVLGTLYLVLGTWYNEVLSLASAQSWYLVLGTLYNEVLLLVSRLLRLF
jgi:hypothetical protein